MVLQKIIQEFLLVRKELLFLDNILQYFLPRFLPHRLDGDDVLFDTAQLRSDLADIVGSLFHELCFRTYAAPVNVFFQIFQRVLQLFYSRKNILAARIKLGFPRVDICTSAAHFRICQT